MPSARVAIDAIVTGACTARAAARYLSRLMALPASRALTWCSLHSRYSGYSRGTLATLFTLVGYASALHCGSVTHPGNMKGTIVCNIAATHSRVQHNCNRAIAAL